MNIFPNHIVNRRSHPEIKKYNVETSINVEYNLVNLPTSTTAELITLLRRQSETIGKYI